MNHYRINIQKKAVHPKRSGTPVPWCAAILINLYPSRVDRLGSRSEEFGTSLKVDQNIYPNKNKKKKYDDTNDPTH